MVKLNIKWKLETKKTPSVAPLDRIVHLDSEKYIGISYTRKKKGYYNFGLFSLESQKLLWTHATCKKSNLFKGFWLVGDHILIEETGLCKEIWHAIDVKTGKSTIIEGLEDKAFFRFSLDGYAVFSVNIFSNENRDYYLPTVLERKIVVIDPATAKPIELRGNPHDSVAMVFSHGRYFGIGNNGKEFVGEMRTESGVAYFGKHVELIGNPNHKGSFSVGGYDNNYILRRYYKENENCFAVFNWNGKYLGDIDVSEYLPEGHKYPVIYSGGDGKFVFLKQSFKTEYINFIGFDAASMQITWELILDKGCTYYNNKIVHAGRYIVSALGKYGTVKDEQVRKRLMNAGEDYTCILPKKNITRVLDILTGELSIIHDDIEIGDLEFSLYGCDKGIYFRSDKDYSVICYGEFEEEK